MIVAPRDALTDGARAGGGPGWCSTRMLVQGDGVGFSVNHTAIAAGAVMTLAYRHHVEANRIVARIGTVEEMATGKTRRLGPGMMYWLDRHVLSVDGGQAMRIVAVFAPALHGDEVHDGAGGYAA